MHCEDIILGTQIQYGGHVSGCEDSRHDCLKRRAHGDETDTVSVKTGCVR
jgi:hypothetical protein